jgi:hypothetical protein
MHLNDQGTTTPDGLPLEPVQPTNNVPPVVPGTIPDNSSSDASDAPIQAPLDNPEAETPDAPKEPDSPDWFMKDKFKSIDEQAKSYKELSTKMGKYWGSPQENYAVEGIEGVDASDPLIAGLTPALKEMGISQDGFNHLVTQYMESNKQMMKVMEENLRKELTETDAHTYQAIDKWMSDNLTPEEAMMVKNNWLMSADDFKLFNHMRLMAAPSTNVPSTGVSPVKFESSKEVENDKIKYRKELKTGARVQDKNLEDTLAARYRDAVAREIRNKGR